MRQEIYEFILTGLYPSNPKMQCPKGLFPVRPIPFHPNFYRFCPFFFHPFQLPLFPSAQYLSCPFAVSPNFIFAHFSFRPEAISPNFPISPNGHFALFTQGPFLFPPNSIFLISRPKTNRKFSNNLIPQFWTLSLRLLWTAHIIGEEDILVRLFLLSMWLFLRRCLFLGVFRIREILVIFK